MSEHPPNPDLGDAIVRRSPEEVDAYLAVNLAALGARVAMLERALDAHATAILAMNRSQDALVDVVKDILDELGRDDDPPSGPVLYFGDV